MSEQMLHTFGAINRRMLLLALALAAIVSAASSRTFFSASDGGEIASTQAPSVSTTQSRVATLEQRARDFPSDAGLLSQLSSAYVQRARETADPSFYALADTAAKRALAADPNNVQAIDASAGLALSRHDFAGAVALGERARDLAPDVAATYAVITDALVELGRYDEATGTAQQLADLHTDFAAYSRISYIRELHGDINGAIEAMAQAADAGATVKQDAIWSRTLLANLYLTNGDIDSAERQYRQAAAILPGDPQAEFGLARLAIARGNLAEAETNLRSAIEQRPLPEYVITLGDLLWSQGRAADAEQQYALVRAEQQLFAANGVDTDLDLALFDADHDVAPEQTYESALAAYQRRPTVYGADTVAWAAYRAQHLDVAQSYMALAMRLGTRDPRLSYHAAVIAQAAGDRDAALRNLRDALAMKPALSLRYVASAEAALAMLEGALAVD